MVYQSFTLKCHRQLRVKDLPAVPTWWLERDLNPLPFERKAKNLPMSHHAPHVSNVDQVVVLIKIFFIAVINVKLLGGRGTLKRQRELRKLVEKNMHCKDNNDFFSSTPFQSPRAKRFVVSFAKYFHSKLLFHVSAE